ncbi:MAG: hypothetical protein P8123_06095 [bacterium]
MSVCSVASIVAYLVETGSFDSQDGAGARYERGVPKAPSWGMSVPETGVSRRTPVFIIRRVDGRDNIVEAPINAGRHTILPLPHRA